jgi:hypothetical protein
MHSNAVSITSNFVVGIWREDYSRITDRWAGRIFGSAESLNESS